MRKYEHVKHSMPRISLYWTTSRLELGVNLP